MSISLLQVPAVSGSIVSGGGGSGGISSILAGGNTLTGGVSFVDGENIQITSVAGTNAITFTATGGGGGGSLNNVTATIGSGIIVGAVAGGVQPIATDLVAGGGIGIDRSIVNNGITINNTGVKQLSFNSAPFTGDVAIRGDNGIEINVIDQSTVAFTNSGVVGLTDGNTIATGIITLAGQGCTITASTDPEPAILISVLPPTAPTSITNGNSVLSIDTGGNITADTSKSSGNIVLSGNGETTTGTANLFIANGVPGSITITGNVDIKSDIGGGNHVNITSDTASIAIGNDTINPTITLKTLNNDITLTNSSTQIVCGLDADTAPITGLFVSPTRLLWNNATIGGGGGVTSISDGTTALTGAITVESADASIEVTAKSGGDTLNLSVQKATNIVINPATDDRRGIQILNNATGDTAPPIKWYEATADVLTDAPAVSVQWNTNDADPAFTLQCHSNSSGGLDTGLYPITSFVGNWIAGKGYNKGCIAISPINNNAYVCLIFNNSSVDPSADATNWKPLNASGGVSSLSDGTTALTGAISLIAGEGVEITTSVEARTMTFSSDPFVGIYNLTTAQNLTATASPWINNVVGLTPDPQTDTAVMSYDAGTGIWTVQKAGVFFLNFSAGIIQNGATWTFGSFCQCFIVVLVGGISPKYNICNSLTPSPASGVGSFNGQVFGYIPLTVGSTITCGFQWYLTAVGDPVAQFQPQTSSINNGTNFNWAYIKPLTA